MKAYPLVLLMLAAIPGAQASAKWVNVGGADKVMTPQTA